MKPNKREQTYLLYTDKIHACTAQIEPLQAQLSTLYKERDKLLQYFRTQKQRELITEKDYQNILK